MWVDNGRGGWMWQETNGVGFTPEEERPDRPLYPPESAGGGPTPSNGTTTEGGTLGQARPGSTGVRTEASPATSPSSSGPNIGRFGVTSSIDTDDPAQRGQQQLLKQDKAKFGFYDDPNTDKDESGNVADGLYLNTSDVDDYIKNLSLVKDEITENTEEDTAERTGDLADLINRYDNVSVDNTDSDETRALQRDIFDRQTGLMDKILSFDPKAYSDQFFDSGLAAMNARARSTRGGQNAVNAAEFGVQEQAPALFAQGQQQANELQNRRYEMAGNIAAESGQLATQTRSQDEGRAQFTATLGKNIIDSISAATGQDWQLDAQSTAHLGDMAIEISRLELGGLQLNEKQQEAVWANLTERYKSDNALMAVMKQIEADAKRDKKSKFEKFLGYVGMVANTAGTAAKAITDAKTAVA